MERLTESRLDGSGMLKACENCDVGAEFDCLDCFAWEEAINRLAKLEDMLEKGIGMSSIDIYIKDKPDGEIHRIGDNQHDGLYVDSNGTVCYQNLQNGDGCGANRHYDTEAGYEFMPSNFGDLLEITDHSDDTTDMIKRMEAEK